MQAIRFTGLLIVALLLLGDRAWADPVSDAADAAIQAHAAGDTVRLRVIAQAAAPDPWLVAEDLCARGAFDAATALAGATEARDVRTLADYIARRRKTPGASKHRERLLEAGRALEAGEAKSALASLSRIDGHTDDVPSVMTLFAIGLARQALDEPGEASFAHASEIAERLGWLAMATRARVAAIHEALAGGRLDMAKRHVLQLLPIAAARDRSGEVAYGHEQLAVIAVREGDYGHARKQLDIAAAKYRTALDTAGQAACCISLGDLHLRAGRLPEAEAAHREALELATKLGSRALEARARRGIGVDLARLGAYAKAEAELTKAKTLAEAEGLDDVRADALANLGVVLLNRGQYGRALAFGQEGLELRAAGSDHAGIAAALMNLGLTHASLGKSRVALRYLDRAHKVYTALADTGGMSRALTNMGIVHGTLGSLDDALRCQEQALVLAKRMQSVSAQSLVMGRIGHVHGQRGDYSTAIAHQREAIRLQRLVRDRLGEAISLERIGHLEQQLGNYAEAEARRRESVYLSDKLGALDITARNHWGLAELAMMSADPERALKSAHAAVKALPSYARGLFDEQGASARERWAGVYDVGMAAAAMTDDVSEFVWFLERQRAATLLESLGGREALMDVAVPDHLRIAEAAAREAEARALRQFRDASDAGRRREIRKARAALADARHRLRESREAIARDASAAAQLIDPKPVDARRLRRLPRPGEALVLYALLPDRAYAVVATTRGVRLVDLGSARVILEACSGLAIEGPGAIGDAMASRFGELLVEPLGLDKRIKRVLVAPDGAACSVPFGLLLPERDVVYIPSATTYDFLRKADRATSGGTGVLALGRPVYGPMEVQEAAGPNGTQRTVRKSHPAGVLAPLDGSAAEVRAVGDVVLTDGEATEDALKAAVLARARWRAVHLACHGLVDFDDPLFSALALTPNKYGDGLLTTLDVFGMQVPADLVVLSACETGRGRLLRTEGVFGFTRAFMYAGTSRVVVSLWKVDDEATRALMVKFYELWNPGGTKRKRSAAEALRLAKEHVRAQPKWADPYYWAAWQLWGIGD